MKIYHYDEQTGELIGEGMADADPLDAGNWLIPAHATNVEPPAEITGSTRHFIAGGWEYRDIPPPVIDEPMPIETKAIDPAPYVPTRADEIKNRLFELDQLSVRASRAIAVALASNAMPKAGDVQTLADIETEAIALRTELATLA